MSPYINQFKRDYYDPGLQELGPFIDTEGDLNFVITKLALRFLEDHGTDYATINTIIGVLECAKLEAYARVARPYEDEKIAQNGDVYS